VRIPPGSSVQTLTPKGATSIARESLKPPTALGRVIRRIARDRVGGHRPKTPERCDRFSAYASPAPRRVLCTPRRKSMCPRSPGSPPHSSARTVQTAHSLRYFPEHPAARIYPLPTARPLLRRLRRALPVSQVSPARRIAPPGVPVLPSGAPQRPRCHLRPTPPRRCPAPIRFRFP